MKRLTLLLAFFLCPLVMNAQKMVFVPQWTPQAQFSGFYVAQEKGFYAEEGLDVEIRHIGANSSENPMDLLLGGEAQIVGQQLIQSIIARADGRKILNVMSITQESGLCCVSRNPISDPKELDSLKVGRWKVGYADFCDMLEAYSGITVNWVPFLNGINLYIYGAVDATLCYTFSELISLDLAIGDIPDDHIIRFSEFGYDCPEDGLYVTEDYYSKNKESVDKFVRASIRGWEYAREHKGEALEISWKYVQEGNITTNREHQRRMLEEYLRLQMNKNTGFADFAPVTEELFDKIVGALLETGYITNKVEYNELVR